ncbi:MAG: hypothetical protein NTX25_10720 [Proteobacteria bacterium]|nr:hypothetical protein [Pseudomonadota bacterium]
MKSSSQESSHPSLIGCHSAWSSHPLVQELEKYAPRFTLLKDDCSGLAKKLELGELNFAFCSSLSLIRQADFEMALPVGLAVDGSSSLALWGISNHHSYLKDIIDARIDSLREVFRWAQLHKTDNLKAAVQNLNEGLAALPLPTFETLPTMKLAHSSSSWNALARLLYKLIFGAENYSALLRMSTSGTCNWASLGEDAPSLDLRVENEALQKRCSYRQYYDLGEIWRNITGLPFVSNILLKNRRLSTSCRSGLAEVLELAQMRMQVEPCNYLPDILPRNCQQQSIDLCSMWKNVHYRLGAQDLRGLLLFLSLIKPLEKKSLEDETFTLKMLRWQQKDSFLGGQLA